MFILSQSLNGGASQIKATRALGSIERALGAYRPRNTSRKLGIKSLGNLIDATSSARMPETRSESKLVWIDCEMTGLDHESDTILSLACFITDPNLNLLDEQGYEAVIHHDREALDRMGEWCTDHHGASGLTKAALESTTSADEAARGLLDYIKKFAPEPRSALLAGNTVHCDKMFLLREPFRPVIEHLHYRIFDVSAIKEAARRWAPEEALQKTPRSKGLHEARADILESIEEARFYRKAFFLQPSP